MAVTDPLVYTQTDIDTLKAAIVSGVLTVTFDGPPKRSITYQDLPAMRSLLADMVRQVCGKSVNYRRAKHARGFRR